MEKFIRLRALLLVVGLVFVSLPLGRVSGAVLCVNPGGTDGCFATIQTAINNAAAGDTIHVAAGTYNGHVTMDKSLTLLLADGVLIQNDSPCFVINASYTSILAQPGAVCVPTGGSNGIDVADDLVNIVVDGLEIAGAGQTTGDGIAFAGAVTDIVLVDNYLHDLDGNGIEFTAAPAGVVDIHGNLFQNNAGKGIEAGAFIVPAEYNSWGHVNGAAAGDGASSGVVVEPYTHVDLYLVSSGTPWADQVVNGEQFTLAVNARMVNVNAADFVLTYDPALLAVASITPGANFDGLYTGDPATEQELVDDSVAGRLHFRGFKLGGIVTADVTLFTVTFETLDTGLSLLGFDELTDGFGMPGVGSSSNIYAAALSDGAVKVIDLPTISSSDIQGYYLTGDEQGFSVTIDNPSTGGSFAGVLVDLKITGADLTDITSLYYWETALEPDDWALWTLTEDGSGNLVGAFGPPVTGFPLSAPYNVTTPFKVTFANDGSYPVELKLRDVATGEILATYINTAVVYEKPVITSADLGDPYLVGVPEPVTLTITNPSPIPEPFLLAFELPAGTTIVYGGVTYTCDATGCPPIAVTLPLGSNDLPFTITFTTPYTGEITVALFDSDWTPAARELASLTVTTGAYENYPVTGSFIIEFTTSEYGFPGFNAYYTGIPVTLTRAGTPPFTTTSITTAPEGTNIQFTNVMAGTYEITTNMPRVLNIYSGTEDGTRTMHKLFEVTGATTITPLALFRGNANWEDNKISILDAVMVASTYDQTGDLDGDVNFDGKVSLGDLTIVGGNYSLTSYGVYFNWTP